MSVSFRHSQEGASARADGPAWPQLPRSGPTRRFEVEYLVRSQAARLRSRMQAAGIEHGALLNLGHSLDPQRVAGFVSTENLFYNAVALATEREAQRRANELGPEQRACVHRFVDTLRHEHPLSKRALEQVKERPSDWQEVLSRSVQTD